MKHKVPKINLRLAEKLYFKDPFKCLNYFKRQKQLIDGRSRLMACFEVGQEIRTEIKDSDPYEISLSANLERRQLSVGQKAMIALEIESHYAAVAKQRQIRKPIKRLCLTKLLTF